MTLENEKKLVDALEVQNEILLVIAKQLSLICQDNKMCRDVSGQLIDDLDKWMYSRGGDRKDEIPD